MLTAKRKVGLVLFPAFDWAITPEHPEREERLLYTQDQILEEGILDIDGIYEFRPGIAAYEDIERVHFCVPDADSQTTEPHLIAAGGVITAAEAVMEKKVDSSFALVRPPGHHAMKVVHGNRGFCNINTEAIMIEYLRDKYGIKKVAIVDTDCHHGDGTQDIYWHDPDTLFISLHQDGRTIFPRTGYPEETGGPGAYGYTLNIPLPPYTGDEGFLYVLDNFILPVLDEFKPELIINSAGQDNHYTDPITKMKFSAQGYATLTDRLKPHIAVLEGGYAIEGALPYLNTGILLAMAGIDYSYVKEPDYDPSKFCQSEATTVYIKELISDLWNKWRKKDKVKKEKYEDKRWYERYKSIYYDTQGFFEKQRERIRLCNECKGFFSIESIASSGKKVLALHIPAGACKICRKVARNLYLKVSKIKYDWVYLQDRTEKSFERR